MRAFHFALILAIGGMLTVAGGTAEARTRHHGAKHHHVLKKTHVRHAKHRVGNSSSLAGVTPVLAAKARQIVADCGSVIISAISHRGNRSNHPIGRAVDVRGNPGCVYAHLKGWPGGYSTDYATVQHVHISYNPGGQEWGLRFTHNGSWRNSTRYARRGMSRYAMHPGLPTAATEHNVH